MASKELIKKITIRKDSTCDGFEKAVAIFNAKKNALELSLAAEGDSGVENKFPVYIKGTTEKVGILWTVNDASYKAIELNSLKAFVNSATYGSIKPVKIDDRIIECEVIFESSIENVVPVTSENKTKKSENVTVTRNGWSDPNGLPSLDYNKTVNELIAEIVKRGYQTREYMDEVLEVMRSNHFSDGLIRLCLSKYRTYINPSVRPKTIYIDAELKAEIKKYGEGKLARAVRAALMNCPLVCQGPKACGKNAFMETVAWLLGQPWYLLSFNRQMNTVSFFGEKTTDNSAQDFLRNFTPEEISVANQAKEIRDKVVAFAIAHQKNAEEIDKVLEKALSEEQKLALKKLAEFEKAKALAATTSIVQEKSVFVDALTDGGVMIFNEMNMIDPNIFSAIANPLCDGTGKLLVPGKGELPIHPDFHLFGTQNEEYEGCEEANTATISRFKAITFEQPKDVLNILTSACASEVRRAGFDFDEIQNLPSWNKKCDCFTQATTFYKQCMGAVGDEITDSVLNIRGFARALMLYVTDYDNVVKLSGLLDESVIQTCPPDERLAIKTVLTNCVSL
ncbi:MAG: AAA family ATPase [Lachnospiraceae bacterium]|nr:AAA family ATPase [Lachnospiraceae bacterium]